MASRVLELVVKISNEASKQASSLSSIFEKLLKDEAAFNKAAEEAAKASAESARQQIAGLEDYKKLLGEAIAKINEESKARESATNVYAAAKAQIEQLTAALKQQQETIESLNAQSAAALQAENQARAEQIKLADQTASAIANGQRSISDATIRANEITAQQTLQIEASAKANAELNQQRARIAEGEKAVTAVIAESLTLNERKADAERQAAATSAKAQADAIAYEQSKAKIQQAILALAKAESDAIKASASESAQAQTKLTASYNALNQAQGESSRLAQQAANSQNAAEQATNALAAANRQLAQSTQNLKALQQSLSAEKQKEAELSRQAAQANQQLAATQEQLAKAKQAIAQAEATNNGQLNQLRQQAIALEQRLQQAQQAQVQSAQQLQQQQQAVTSTTTELAAAQRILAQSAQQAGVELEKETQSAKKNGLSSLIEDATNLSQTFFFVQNAVQSFAQTAVGAFDSTAGQAIQLEKQVLGLQGTFAALNQVSFGGKVLTEPLEKIVQLEQPVRQAIARIREISLDISGTTSGELVNVFQTIATNAGAANLSLAQSVDLTKGFSAALITANIPLAQQRQEVSSILQGQISSDSALAKQLGITNEIVAKEKARGTLVEFLNQKFDAAVKTQALFAKTFEGVTSNIQELVENIQLSVGQVILQPVVDQLNLLYEGFKANKSAIEGFFVGLATSAVQFGGKLKEAFDAIYPLIAEAAKAVGTFASAFGATLGAAIAATLEVVKVFANVLSTVLKPVFQLLNTEIGKFAVVGAAIAAAISTVIIPAFTGLAQIIGAGTVSLGAFAASAAAALLPLAPLAAAIGLVAAGLEAQKIADSTEALNTYTDTTFSQADASRKLAEELKSLNDQRIINGELTDEQVKREKALLDSSQSQIKINNQLIKDLEAQKTAAGGNTEVYDALIKNLQKANEQLDKTTTAALPIKEIGTTFEQLGQKADSAFKVIRAGVGDTAAYNAKAKELIDTINKQLDAGIITGKQAEEKLKAIVGNSKLEVDIQKSAQEAITKAYETEGKRRQEVISANTKKIEQEVQTGKKSQLQGEIEITSAVRSQLLIQEENIRASYDRRRVLLENDAKAAIAKAKELADGSKAILDAAIANDNGTASSQARIAQFTANYRDAYAKLGEATASFENQRAELNRESSVAIQNNLNEQTANATRLAKAEIAEKRQLLQQSLTDSQNAIKASEQQSQAEIQALRLKGFESELQLSQEVLDAKKENIQAEIELTEQKIAKEKEILASDTTLTKQERQAKLNEITQTELQLKDQILAKGQLEIEQQQLLIEAKVKPLELEKTAYEQISKLLATNNELRQAGEALEKAIADSAIQNSELRLKGLQEAQSLRREAMTEEQKAADDQIQKANELAIKEEERRLAKERLIELGVREGATQAEIAQSIREEEVNLAGLKARRFETEQIAARANLEIQIQQREIQQQQLEVEGKIALAKAGNNQEAIAAAQALIALAGELGGKNQQISDLQRQSFEANLAAQTEAFNAQQSQDDYTSRQKAAKEGVFGLEPAFAGVKDAIAPIAENLESASSAADKLKTGIAETNKPANALKDALTEVGKTIDANTGKAKDLNAELAKKPTANQDQSLTGQVGNLINSGNTTKTDSGNTKVETGYGTIELTPDQAKRVGDFVASGVESGLESLATGKASGGHVYEVNEQGQESWTRYDTGETELLPEGRRFVTFPSNGFVHTASETNAMKEIGVLPRADGGIVGAIDTKAEALLRNQQINAENQKIFDAYNKANAPEASPAIAQAEAARAVGQKTQETARQIQSVVAGSEFQGEPFGTQVLNAQEAAIAIRQYIAANPNATQDDPKLASLLAEYDKWQSSIKNIQALVKKRSQLQGFTEPRGTIYYDAANFPVSKLAQLNVTGSAIAQKARIETQAKARAETQKASAEKAKQVEEVQPRQDSRRNRSDRKIGGAGFGIPSGIPKPKEQQNNGFTIGFSSRASGGSVNGRSGIVTLSRADGGDVSGRGLTAGSDSLVQSLITEVRSLRQENKEHNAKYIQQTEKVFSKPMALTVQTPDAMRDILKLRNDIAKETLAAAGV